MNERDVESSGIRIGYICTGSSYHGIRRYAESLADAVGCFAGVTTDVLLIDEGGTAIDQLRRKCRDKGVLHLQVGRTYWGKGWTRFRRLRAIISRINAPVVVTMHDVYFTPARRAGAASSGNGPDAERSDTRVTSMRRAVRKITRVGATTIPDRLTRDLLFRRADAVVTGSEEEKRRLIDAGYGADVHVIHHFARLNAPVKDRDEIREALGLNGVVLTCLGWIHPRKGIDTVIKALTLLPEEYRLVIAGGSTERGSGHEKSLRRLVSETDLEGRVRFTGALADNEYRDYLVATDIGICAFRDVSSSGSLTDWIGSGTPVVASNLPLIAEYNDIVADSIAAFELGGSENLAWVIEAVRADIETQARRIRSLSESLSTGRSALAHLEIYKSVISS